MNLKAIVDRYKIIVLTCTCHTFLCLRDFPPVFHLFQSFCSEGSNFSINCIRKMLAFLIILITDNTDYYMVHSRIEEVFFSFNLTKS